LGRDTFDHLVFILSQNPLFHSPQKKQCPVKYQLAAFLIRYGQQGSDVFDVAAKLSIAHGSVHNYCKRVSQAIQELQPGYLKWMDEPWNEVVSGAIAAYSGLFKCLGSCDGCQIHISEAPLVDGEQFHS
jgi:hypothetical protein